MGAISGGKKPTKQAYHHGDLRRALLDVATDLVRHSGPAALTVRNVVGPLDVTHAAFYHHFADRASILAAVAEQAFEDLIRAMDRAAETESTALGRYRAMGEAYLRFAISNPNLYQSMFGADAASPVPQLREVSQRVFDRINGAIVAAQEEGTIAAGSARDHTLFCWSAVHGLAALLAEGHLGGGGLVAAEVEEAIETVMTRIYRGLSHEGWAT